MLWGTQEIPEEHLHAFQLFIHATNTTNVWSQQHFSSWSALSQPVLLQTHKGQSPVDFRFLKSCIVATIHLLCSWSSTTSLLSVYRRILFCKIKLKTIITYVTFIATDDMHWLTWGPTDVIKLSMWITLKVNLPSARREWLVQSNTFHSKFTSRNTVYPYSSAWDSCKNTTSRHAKSASSKRAPISQWGPHNVNKMTVEHCGASVSKQHWTVIYSHNNNFTGNVFSPVQSSKFIGCPFQDHKSHKIYYLQPPTTDFRWSKPTSSNKSWNLHHHLRLQL